MPLTYVDPSALAKRYVPEVGSPWVVRLCNTEPIAISLIAVTEMASAIARRTREGSLTEGQRDALYRTFIADLESFVVVAIHQAVVERAAAYLLSVPPAIRLRSLDAIHVSSAENALDRSRRNGIATGLFVSSDLALLAAARWVGLDVVNPEDHR
jgi:uncharacterized protein